MFKLILLGFVTMVTGVAMAVQPNTDVDMEDVAIERAYVPVGFDTNDSSVEVIVVGTFKNTCYQKGDVEWKRDDLKGEVTLTMKAYRYNDGTCWPIPNDFFEVVDLKMIPVAGDYELIDTTSGKSLGRLPITAAKDKGPGRDDFPYAPVSDAYIKPSLDLKGHEVYLQGVFPNNCMEIGALHQHFYPDVIVIQPVVKMKKAPEGKVCEFGRFPYLFKKKLEKRLDARTYLLHVRKMQGGSINRFVSPFSEKNGVSVPSLIGDILEREGAF